jgi:hypothetical protein
MAALTISPGEENHYIRMKHDKLHLGIKELYNLPT